MDIVFAASGFAASTKWMHADKAWKKFSHWTLKVLVPGVSALFLVNAYSFKGTRGSPLRM